MCKHIQKSCTKGEGDLECAGVTTGGSSRDQKTKRVHVNSYRKGRTQKGEEECIGLRKVSEKEVQSSVSV